MQVERLKLELDMEVDFIRASVVDELREQGVFVLSWIVLRNWELLTELKVDFVSRKRAEGLVEIRADFVSIAESRVLADAWRK